MDASGADIDVNVGADFDAEQTRGWGCGMGEGIYLGRWVNGWGSLW